MTARKTFRIAVRKFGPFESAIRKQWDAFEGQAQTGLTLDAQVFDLEPLSDTLFDKEGLLSGEWDVAFLNTDWLARVHSIQAVVDLAPMLNAQLADGFPGGWSPSLLRAQEIGGKILGLPYHDGPECLIYRKDLFEDAREQSTYESRFGSALRAPETWIEFQTVARFFQRPEKNLYGTVFAAYPDGHNTVYDFLLQLWTRGGELFDSSERIQFETPEAISALRFYREMLRDRSAVHPRSRDFDSVGSGLAFVDGQVAMMVNWFGFAAMAETVADSHVRGCVDIAAIPHDDGHCSTSMNVYWVLSIAAGSPHREVAFQFLRHAISPEMDKLLTLEGAVGCRKSTWNDSEVNRVIPFFNRLEKIHGFARELPHREDWPKVAALIDDLVVQTINSDIAVEKLVLETQSKVNSQLKSIAG
jgi:multiple sugar transport system substrate-binding protein